MMILILTMQSRNTTKQNNYPNNDIYNNDK